ncbi:hypothetical protein V865_005449 [Kwoniella europaea PYCC6329]|uniref:F-box domain-containing protein n=1 Tax=Kwoniella europaea PYCC6329 TaxID=1423913 RepID=A0AAX4KLP6_9TREE
MDDYESLDILRYADVSPGLEDVQVLISDPLNNVECYSKDRRTYGEPAGSVLLPNVREMIFSCLAQEDQRQVLTLAVSSFPHVDNWDPNWIEPWTPVTPTH